ncbi:molybdenum cofactor guanylyltransferase [Leptospira fletcheri]|uniref:Probable molybdenum cofactor guanylyltransferase n=1 Tax=Leptospira fletcheri TaxID=2484981 RepID=A0A4R9G4J3_9LEPT|nr:molybdenum cofactor guanylyltransferase [Leptospira fletcheri]TGK06263.1 molybdenum cofactor guanylyltransferase [Leptospira fletcheri]
MNNIGIEPIGVLLAGGFSSRMGRDKALLPLGKKESLFLTRSFRKLRFLCSTVFVSVREEQIPSYSEWIPPENLLPDEPFSFGGPLKGILSVFSHCVKNAILSPFLTLPVDMPKVRIRTLERLKSLGKNSSEGVFYAGADGPEPLCGFYPLEYLADWRKECESGRIVDASPRSKILSRNPLLLELPRLEKDSFRNINVWEDYINIK